MPFDKSRLQVLHVRLVKRALLPGDKEDTAVPEVLLRVMCLQPWAHGITLAHVQHLAIALLLRTQQQIDAGAVELLTLFDIG